MHEPAGLLLILLLVLTSLAALLSPFRRSQTAATALLTAELVLIALVAVVVCGWGTLQLTGPVWLRFDAAHAVHMSGQAGAWSLWALALVAAARWSDGKDAFGQGLGMLLPHAGLVLLAVADDWVLMLAGWILAAMVPCDGTDDVRSDPARIAASLGSGLRLSSAVFVALGLGLLAWNLPVSSWSELSRWLAEHPEPTRPQQALLFLSGFCGILGACLAAGLFPFHSLQIESDEDSPLWQTSVGRLSGLIPAWTLLWKLQPLLVLDPAIATLGKAIAALTFLLGSVAALAQRDRIRTRRTIYMAHAGLVVLGLLQSTPELRTVGALHGLLLLVWMQTGERGGSSFTLAFALLHSGLDGVGSILSVGGFPGAGIPSLLAWFALTFSVARLALDPASGRSEQTSSPAGAAWKPFIPLVWGIPLSVAGTRLFVGPPPDDAFEPMTATVLGSSWEFFAATLLAMATGVIWIRSLRSTPEFLARFGSLSRLCESHFSLTSLWVVLIRLPLQIAGILASALEEGTLRGAGRHRAVAEDRQLTERPSLREFAGWELARGLLCVAVLCLLLLWKGA